MAETTVRSAWASTKPGHNRYHYYDAKGKSLCSYQRREGELFTYACRDQNDVPADACTSCELHFLRGAHLQAKPNAEQLPEGTRVEVVRGKLRGAIGRIQRWDAEARMYFVEFGGGAPPQRRKQLEPLVAADIEEMTND